MSHGDAIIDRDGIELFGNTTRAFDFTSHQLAKILQMHVAGDKLSERVNDGDDGLLEVTIFHARCTPQRSRSRHISAGGGGSRTILGHVASPVVANSAIRLRVSAYLNFDLETTLPAQ